MVAPEWRCASAGSRGRSICCCCSGSSYMTKKIWNPWDRAVLLKLEATRDLIHHHKPRMSGYRWTRHESGLRALSMPRRSSLANEMPLPGDHVQFLLGQNSARSSPTRHQCSSNSQRPLEYVASFVLRKRLYAFTLCCTDQYRTPIAQDINPFPVPVAVGLTRDAFNGLGHAYKAFAGSLTSAL